MHTESGEIMKELSKNCQNGKHTECLRYYCDCRCHRPNKRLGSGKPLSKTQSDELERITKKFDERFGSLDIPEIRTRFLKGKIKGVRLGKLSTERIDDALSSLHLGDQRYKTTDFRYIAELIHMEHMLYRERQPDFTGGAGWGIGIGYLKEKYPKEYLAMLDELDPKGKHRERFAQNKLEKARKEEEYKQRSRKSKSEFRKWWLEKGGKT